MNAIRYTSAIAALLACASWPAAADATWPGKPGLVGYDGKNGIETVRPDGTHHRVLLRAATTNGFAWSAGGREIAFAPGVGIWVMRADGSHKRVIVDSGFFEPDRYTETASPAWGPRGHRLVFTASSTWADPDNETPPRTINWIWSVHRDGTHLRKLVRGTEAVWSRSGAHIRFIDEDYDIVEIKADGSGRRVLAGNSEYTHSLDLAPGGRRLVYQTGAGGRDTTFRTLDVRNGARTKFSLRRLGVGDVAWAPGGRRLAYVFYPPYPRRIELRTILPNGRGIRTVTKFPDNYAVSDLAWQTR